MVSPATTPGGTATVRLLTAVLESVRAPAPTNVMLVLGVAVAVGVGGWGIEEDRNCASKVCTSAVPQPVVRSYPSVALNPGTPLKVLFPAMTSRKPERDAFPSAPS